VEALLTPGVTRRLLLSDASQSHGRGIDYPPGLQEVNLSEVVRCSKRIVAGAMAFQLGGEQKLLTKCHHEATGPPLKSFLFDVEGDEAGGHSLYTAYAEHVCRALEHVASTFSGLSLHNRVALVVPDQNFRDSLRPVLEAALAQRFSGRAFRLVCAERASADLSAHASAPGDDEAPEEEDQDWCDVACDVNAGGGEWLVFDTIHQLDGLERLIVVGVGLDSKITGDGAACSEAVVPGVATLETRSMLYRAVTRAHLMVVVVNEFLHEGWLEFLGSVRLRDDEAFDSDAAIRRSEAQAVEGVVKAELSKRVAAAATQRSLQLPPAALAALVSDVAAAQERGSELDVAIERVLRLWAHEAQVAVEALLPAFVQVKCDAPEGVAFENLVGRFALALHRGEVINISVFALEVVKTYQATKRDEDISALLDQASEAVSMGRLDTHVIATLSKYVVVALERGEEMRAVDTVFTGWRATLQTLDQRLRAEAGLQDCEVEKVTKTAIAALCSGDTIEQALRNSLRKWRSERRDDGAQEALERAAAGPAGSQPVCRAGGRAMVRGVSRESGLQDKEVVLLFFLPEKSRWAARPEGARKAVLLRPANLESLAPNEKEEAALREVLPILRPFVSAAVAEGVTDSADLAATGAVKRWRVVQAQAAAALEHAAKAQQLRLGDAAAGLARRITEQVWEPKLQPAPMRGSAVLLAPDEQLGDDTNHSEEEDDDDDVDVLGVALDEEVGEAGWQRERPPRDINAELRSEVDGAFFSEAVDSVLTEWAQGERLAQEEAAEIAAALEAEAHSSRLLLTDAAALTLQRKVAAALRRGASLEDAVAAAMREYHKQVVRRQVQQTIWDPSGNHTRRITGVVRFMPFKQSSSDRVDYEMLPDVFAMLPFRQLGEIARVCKRWRAVAADPSWKPELIVYAWGEAAVTGISKACPRPTLLEFSLARPIVQITCANSTTFALTESGEVWFWGRSWLTSLPSSSAPTRIEELSDIVSVSCTPAGYFHGSKQVRGFGCAAITRSGGLYTWGWHLGHLLHRDREVEEPRRIPPSTLQQQGSGGGVCRVLHAVVGLDYLALQVERITNRASDVAQTAASSAVTRTTSVMSVGSFRAAAIRPHELRVWPDLDDVPLRQLVAGCFHCCALTTRGELYTWGNDVGQDGSNGNLLGHGDMEDLARQGQLTGMIVGNVMRPKRVELEALGPVAEVACSSYSTVAITVDGRVFTWGDYDGNALGHNVMPCHIPTWLHTLRWHRIAHGSAAYTNGAVATDDGRVFVWGGNYWEGGIAEGRDDDGPTEVKWGGVPSCYRCSSVALAHRHGFLVFRKEP